MPHGTSSVRESRIANPRKHVITMKLNDSEFECVQKLRMEQKISPAEAIRRYLPQACQALVLAQQGMAPELTMSGDSITLENKSKVLVGLSKGKGVAMMAQELSMTMKAINWWREKDPVFNQLCSEYWASSVEQVDHRLWEKAIEGNVTACCAQLNAKHPEYGMVRPDMLKPIFDKMLETVLSIARNHVPTTGFESFRRDLLGAMRGLMGSIGGGRRR